MFFIAPLLVRNPVFDLTTVLLIAVLLLLSLLSLCFIFHLRFKSRSCHHLQSFNSLWSVRFLLVTFVSLWAINELLRVSLFRCRYLFPSWPTFSIRQQSNLCKLHAVLSIGLFEPGFLITLLFLMNISVKKKNPNEFGVVGFVLVTCLPILLLQILIVFYSPLKDALPRSFNRSYVVIKHDYDKTLLCAYPLMSTIAFGGFGIGYLLWFLFSCWKVVSLVINKSLRIRVYGLAFTIMIALPLQILFLGLSAVWRPDEPAYSVVVLVVFLSTFLCAAAGEGILVIVPITDSLAAGGECQREYSWPLKPLGDES